MVAKKKGEDKFAMSVEQKELFNKLTVLNKKIVINTLDGMKPAEAHRAAGGKSKTEESRRKLASEILTKPDVKAFLDSMMEVKVSNAVMSRQEMMERLSNLSRVNMNDLIEWQQEEVEGEDDEGNQTLITQSMWRVKDSAMQDPNKMAAIAEVVASKDGLKIKKVNELAAMKQLADLAGYNKPTEVNLNHRKADEAEW